MIGKQKKKEKWRSTWVDSPIDVITRRQDRIEQILKDNSIHCTDEERIDFRKELNDLESERRKLIFSEALIKNIPSTT